MVGLIQALVREVELVRSPGPTIGREGSPGSRPSKLRLVSENILTLLALTGAQRNLIYPPGVASRQKTDPSDFG
jgi:hypothetical protein